ncbi:low molecular weight protein-tyrosine-phosphatase [Aminobacter sp. P9b]|uniref:protein-tyrosine-phosphatase n=1 Tax=Aminobacter niigataensis TaxID=83265 RepID=A0ABR6L6P1_9HYPH|nr:MULTISPECIES: low molecular weight protein-tyrosine-phosphatase [Aminobacter]AWC21591.1 Low molecular weight protein-tyrosine-phosphatase YfkJ [Aminobacter sp. MSH1]MBB4651646.1 protein-tyrosine phosphatase [Aminobacter niigataensis]CAI2932297.1 Low molecular weight protein-tyrosine-phosphatase [Aminobacter niigataensis]
MVEKQVKSILFVCLGNICRSPLAEGVFRAVLAERGLDGEFTIDSAGTGGWHAGSAPDPRSIAVAAQHGIDIAAQQARKVVPADFERFDLILAMDRSNADDLRALAPQQAQDRVELFLGHVTDRPQDVPDPYYGGEDGFLVVYRMIREASEALADRISEPASEPLSGHASSTM